MRKLISALSLFAVLFLTHNVSAQNHSVSYKSEIFSSFSTGENTPFWMLYHNYGMVPLDANNFYLRGDIYYGHKINQDWSVKGGVSLAGSTPHSYGTIWLQQAFAEINWKSLRLDVGAKEDYTSLLDPNLSSGDFDYSNNSRPRPQIRASMPNFEPIPFLGGNIYVKGDIGVGFHTDGDWMEDEAKPYNQQYLKNVKSHNKSIYFRLGNIEKKNKLQLTVGFIHQALWGADMYRYDKKQGRYEMQRQDNGLDGLLRIMLLKEGSGSASEGDQVYFSGSSVGSYHLRYDYKVNDSYQLSAYMQHFFEDGSGVGFVNYKDNLLGVQYKSTKKQLLSNVLFEYVYTKHQSGPIHFNEGMSGGYKERFKSKGTGNDNYYNNYDYIQGPSYYGRTIGTPLFLSPEYNKDGYLNFKSNRIIALHLGAEGYVNSNLAYRVLATTGQTWGRYYAPFLEVRDGFATNLDLIYNNSRLKGMDFKLSVGYNKGEFFSEDAFGAGITITKRGIIK